MLKLKISFFLLLSFTFACSSNDNRALYRYLLEIEIDGQFWIEAMESQLGKDEIDEVEFKRSFHRLTLKSTHLYRELTMINRHYDLEFDSDMVEIRNTLEKKSQLTFWFYQCNNEVIQQENLVQLIQVEKDIRKWIGQFIKRIDEKHEFS